LQQLRHNINYYLNIIKEGENSVMFVILMPGYRREARGYGKAGQGNGLWVLKGKEAVQNGTMFYFTCIYLMHSAGLDLHSLGNIFLIFIRPSS
jgi:hypothetical protein